MSVALANWIPVWSNLRLEMEPVRLVPKKLTVALETVPMMVWLGVICTLVAWITKALPSAISKEAMLKLSCSPLMESKAKLTWKFVALAVRNDRVGKRETEEALAVIVPATVGVVP